MPASDTIEKRRVAMPIVAKRYQFVIGVDSHAASHSFAVVARAVTAAAQEVRFPAAVGRHA